ncbi:MAG TPA: DUF3078 domain-containing protein [Phaeodactylibacter sp.]|nr:DUF3078 domain-containing protein [Phaeodactylibacter sp.]
MKLSFLTLVFTFLCFGLQAQDVPMVDEAKLKADKAEKEAQIAALQAEVDAIQAQLDAIPGWQFGSLGTIGFNLSEFTDWLGAEKPNARSTNIGFSGNAFANYDDPKQFWRNAGNITFAKTKIVPDHKIQGDLADSLKIGFTTTADAINASSLYGYKLTPKWAISGLGEYRSTINNFNNPGFLDIGVGATWTPIKDLVVVFHPLNYNFVFSKSDLNYESSLGCKIVADYAKELPMGIAWRSNLSGFISYQDVNNLSNWTWINSFGFTAWKGIGVGFEFGLRGNRQESYNTFLTKSGLSSEAIPIADFDNDTYKGDNPLQTYWLLGLTYNL